MIKTPWASRVRMSPAALPTAVRRVRSTNTERCSLASQLTNGQEATSCLATKETGATATARNVDMRWIGDEQHRRSVATSPST
jgi:hypothetical protein